MPQMQAGTRQRSFRARRDAQRAAARQLQALYDNRQNIGRRQLVYQRPVTTTCTVIVRVPVTVPQCMTVVRRKV